MKTEKTKVIVISVGDAQYPQDKLGAAIDSVRKAVRSIPLAEVVYEGSIMEDKSADKVANDVKDLVFDAIIVNYVSWHITPYVMRTLINYKDKPVLVWGIGGYYDESGKLYAPAATAGTTAIIPALKEMGFKWMLVNEKPGEERRVADVERFIRVAGAVKAVRKSRIGLFGYADMGLYSCAYNKTLAYSKLGVDIEDYNELDTPVKMASFPDDLVKKTMKEILAESKQFNEIPEKTLEQVTRLYLMMKEKRDDRHLDAVSIKCVYGVTQLGFNPCLAQTLLADKDTAVICECDAYGMLTGIIMQSVTGKQSGFVEHYEVFDDSVLVGVCGFIPRDFIDGDFTIRAANLGEFNYGISNVSKMKTGEVTYARLYETNGEYKLFLNKGEALPNPKWTEAGWCEPTPDFPSVLLKPGMDMQHYQETVPGQHIIIVYGDYVKDLELFCRFMGIEVVR